MSPGFLMGLDAGGGGGRCMLVEVDSNRVFTAQRSWRHPLAPGTGGFGYDLDCDLIWRLLGETARQVLKEAGAGPGQVIGLAPTGMRHATVLLERDTKGAGNRVLWAAANRDTRAAGQAITLAQERGDELYLRTGHWPSPIAGLARLIYLKESLPIPLKPCK